MVVDFEVVEALRARHAAWRLLRGSNAGLILAFLGSFFVDQNRGACPASQVAMALDDLLHALNTAIATDSEEVRFPKPARGYLDDWSAGEVGYLRRFYPTGEDEVHYEITPAFEKAHAWVESLQGRAFVGTESRLHIVVDLLRQIVHGTDTDPDARLAELRRRRDELDAQIATVEAGEVAVLDDTGVRDRYQQFAATARELLADFREVEDNFRHLDRAARQKIAAWEGSKGALLAELVGSRSDITGSDQGRSFQAFYDLLLSASRQDELSDLLRRVAAVPAVDADRRVRTIHHDWAEAAERAQRTVRQLSEQLRRFLDDQVWLENRRVLELVRAVETAALQARGDPPAVGLEIDLPGVDISLPFDRPLYEPPASAAVDSLVPPAAEIDLSAEPLFVQTYVDQVRLASNIRTVLPRRSSALLADIVDVFAVEQGAAEIVGYLALSDDDLTVEVDDGEETVLDYADPNDPDRRMRARLPKVTVHRS